MKKKRKLKKPIKVTLSLLFISIVAALVYTFGFNSTPTSMENQFTYVNDYIFDDYYPVVATTNEKVQRPYTVENISLYRSFYDEKGTDKEQEKSIVLSDGTYIPNTGIDYSSDNSFDVVASYAGTVTNITEDAILGKTIEIKSDDNLTIMYQSLSEINVKKGDTVNKGDVIGKSGSCSINKNVKNSLHIEMYLSGQVLNPETVYDKTLKEVIKEYEKASE